VILMGSHSLVIDAADGRQVPALGMVHKVGGDLLDGRMLIMEGVIGPGQLIVPHTHTREDECAYILAGTLTYQIGEQVREVEAGAYVVKPRGVPHAFWNDSALPARVLEIHLPATFDRFYDELAAIFTSHDPAEPAWQREFDQLNERYGLIQHWDLAQQIAERYGVGAHRS
jgi:quercetin dioxygenase-like cupin family protein